jgi:4a-hydroxytetrahydrobiopterin dehydratase
MGFQKWKHLLNPVLSATACGFATLIHSSLSPAQAQPAVSTHSVLPPLIIRRQLNQLPGWQLNNGTLVCTYRFTNFIEAVTFVNALVPSAEALAHHPDITIAYHSVLLALTTHDAGGLTELDFQLAREIQSIATQPPFSLGRCAE